MKFFTINKRSYSITLLLFGIIVMIFTINELIDARSASASIIKKYNETSPDGSLNTITYNGEEMYVTKATFYDYYSDSQVNDSSSPKAITDALDGSKNTFSKFNEKIMNLMKYNSPEDCPALYPLYQGRPGNLSDMKNIYDSSSYWVAAHSGQGTVAATQGLVDPKLKYDNNGNSVITQTNPNNGKSSILPYFNQKFLTTNTFDNSQLPLGKVIDNVSFPFRRVDKNGITYYEFYSSKDTIRFNSNNQLDYFGVDNKDEQVLDAQGGPGFFPYNNKSEGKSSCLNFGHGVKLEIPFNMTKDGKLKGADMIFEFSGDDDVWVYIDDELALDIGGNHGEVSGTINFATGISTVKKVKNHTIAFATQKTSSISNIANSVIDNHQTKFSETLKTKLKDTTKTHTLTMFYMERGLNVANMKLSFNLPEPTKLIINNTLDTSKVNKTFQTDTLELAKKDEFIYDVADKTTSKAAQIGLLPNENVGFINEFNDKDTLIIQESSIKNLSRKLTKLYSTSWILKDASEEIATGKSLLISDKRSKDTDTIIFKNKNNDDTPILKGTYLNTPKTGDYMIVCKVTDQYIKDNNNYSNKIFKYTVTHSNIFGGNSSTKPYIGTYSIFDINNKSINKTTTDGTILLKLGEKTVIYNISVLTKITSTLLLEKDAQVSSIKTTEQFKINNDRLETSGAISSTANTVQYTITSAKETLHKIDNDTIPLSGSSNGDITNNSEDKLVDIKISEDAFDSSPKTSDTFNFTFIILILISSIILTVISLYSLIKQQKL